MTSGAHHFLLSLRLTWLSFCVLTLLQLALFLRPTPDGAAYVLDPLRYLPQAIAFDLLGVFLIAAPFLLLWLIRYTCPDHRPTWRLVPLAQALVLAANLLACQADHEVMRFMGMRLTPSLVATYANASTAGQPTVADALWLDQGGAGSAPLLTLGVPALFLLWAVRRVRSDATRIERMPGRLVAIGLALAPLLITGVVRLQPGGTFRKRKVQPVVLTLLGEWAAARQRFLSSGELGLRAARYQERWLAGSADKAWRFDQTEFPYLRTPATGTGEHVTSDGSGRPWNVLLLQLETLRGWDTGFLRPERAPSPTPFLDRLARDPSTGYWTRCASFGPPTVNNVLAVHCSLLPHTRHYVTTSHTTLGLLSLPEVLRSRDYWTEIHQAADPDWDGERIWFTRWYDAVEYNPSTRDRDRVVFRRAAIRLRELGASGRPFFFALVSAANHYPFRCPEPAFESGPATTPAERLGNTMRYTDDVVRELVEALRREPWFGRTILVIAGDHGYNLGEHDGPPGQDSLFRETLWVPLLIHAAHPGLPRGPQAGVASLVDVAPTLADLLGVRVENPWMGTSLVAGDRAAARLSFVLREGAYHETERRTVLTDAQGRTLAFDVAVDPEQRSPLPDGPEVLEPVLDEARALATLHDTLIESNRIWSGGLARAPGSGSTLLPRPAAWTSPAPVVP